MSTGNIFLIATIALISIVVLFYALEKCAKFLDSTNPEQKRKQKRWLFNRNRPVDKMATILEKHEMFNLSNDYDDNDNTEDESALDNNFSNANHECLAIVIRKGTRVLGINLFRKDLNIEYFWEKIPECCYKDGTGNDEELEIRALLATVHHWSSKWVYAEPVHLICSNEQIVRRFNQNHLKNGSKNLWIRQIESLTERFDYTLLLECSENYVCELHDEELWEDLIRLAKNIMDEENRQHPSIRLKKLKWPKKQVHFTCENWHQLPHVGEAAS